LNSDESFTTLTALLFRLRTWSDYKYFDKMVHQLIFEDETWGYDRTKLNLLSRLVKMLVQYRSCLFITLTCRSSQLFQFTPRQGWDCTTVTLDVFSKNARIFGALEASRDKSAIARENVTFFGQKCAHSWKWSQMFQFLLQLIPVMSTVTSCLLQTSLCLC
jgi:hypothetical protein